MIYDGTDIKYLLGKKGHTLSSIAHELHVSQPMISHVIYGRGTSHRIRQHIERLLGMKPGKLEIARASNRSKVA